MLSMTPPARWRKVLRDNSSGDLLVFDPDKLYPANDPALRVLGGYFTLSRWRSDGTGPAFVRIGRRVLYRGTDLNAFLEANRVEPATAS